MSNKAGNENKSRSYNSLHGFKWLINEKKCLMKLLRKLWKLATSVKNHASEVSILDITARNDHPSRRKAIAVNHELK